MSGTNSLNYNQVYVELNRNPVCPKGLHEKSFASKVIVLDD
jgi:hypothetical protein